MTFMLNGKPLTPALVDLPEGDGLNTEQRRILAENFVTHPSELTNPVAKLAFAHAVPVPHVMSSDEQLRPLLDSSKLEAARVTPVEKLRLFEETKTIGTALAERKLHTAIRTVSETEYQTALLRVKPFLRDHS
jgi:hypothetical protein